MSLEAYLVPTTGRCNACIECGRSAALCPWLREQKPVPGWNAKPVAWRNRGLRRWERSYAILEGDCPLYIRMESGQMRKPDNPYKRGTLTWSVMEGDWEDLTAGQIAEVLGTTRNSVCIALSKIKRETGYVVPHAREQRCEK